MAFTFRQKIFITYVLVFFIFIAIIFPFTQRAVKDIVRKGMADRATEVIEKIKYAEDHEDLIRKIKEQRGMIFFRISVITDEHKVIYDSHTKKILREAFSTEHIVEQKEVLQAFEEGRGYNEDYSETLDQDFAYFAKSFDFHGKTYVLRTAFPLKYVSELMRDFEIGFLGSAIAILLLFTLMTWFVVHYLTRPIQQIIDAIKPYHEGLITTIPTIKLKPENRTDEFGQLANTLNSLSIKIRNQINTLTQERNEKVAVLESLVEGVIAIDERKIINFVNTMAAKLLHKNREDLLDLPIENLDNEICINLLKRCQEENKILTETLEMKRRGEKIFLDLVAAPKQDGAGAILVIQDKTDHYRIIEMRKDFVANASHELKTPITIIRGFAETLHDNPDLPKETSEVIMEKIVNNCQKMNNLIKDLLTLTDIEHIPESRLLETDLTELVQGIKETVTDAYPDANIVINQEKEEDFFLLADPNLLELALTNLVENAAKYSVPPASIAITLDKSDDWLKVGITDKGIGIPKKELESIFQRFYRVDKSRAKKGGRGGSGLGLSIVETIVDKHFGKITVDSEVGKGSTFTVYLPVRRD